MSSETTNLSTKRRRRRCWSFVLADSLERKEFFSLAKKEREKGAWKNEKRLALKLQDQLANPSFVRRGKKRKKWPFPLSSSWAIQFDVWRISKAAKQEQRSLACSLTLFFSSSFKIKFRWPKSLWGFSFLSGALVNIILGGKALCRPGENLIYLQLFLLFLSSRQ